MNYRYSNPTQIVFGLGVINGVGVMLPYVMKYNMAVCPERFADVADALGVKPVGCGVYERLNVQWPLFMSCLRAVICRMQPEYSRTCYERPGH